MKIKMIFSLSVLMLVLITTGCNSSQEKKNDEPTTKFVAQPLPPSFTNENGVAKITGEVIVFFSPSDKRLQEMGWSESETKEKSKSFDDLYRSVLADLQSSNHKIYRSTDDFLKISISNEEVISINTQGVKEGFGIVLTRTNTKNKIISGIVSKSDLMKEIKAYYN